jgi:putative ABC transport system permease protein
MRRAVWPGESALGKGLRFENDWLTVVGVVADTRGSGLASDPLPGFYIPYRQRPGTETELAVGHDAVLLVASSEGIATMSRPLRDAIWEVDQRQPVPEISALDAVMSDGVSPERFRAILLGAFAGIAIVLVVTGTYGVVSYLVAERTHEFAIRMAMGATARDIISSVVRRGVLLAASGVAAGLLAVALTSRVLTGLLFGVTATDPLTLAGAVAIVTMVTLIACLVPALSVGRVDPSAALRADLLRHRAGVR